MRQRLYEYLAERTDSTAASTEELLALILSGPGSDEAFGRHFLAGLLADDPRFEQEPGGAGWRLATRHVLDLPLGEAPFVVVDLETTGHSPDKTGITEIGAVRLQGRQERERFESLVNPGRPIPPYVAKLTGISDSMVAEAPAIEELLESFAHFAADGVLVAHNAAFDVALLDHASRRILGRPLGLPSLCTFKLARRLMPELDRASLDALALHFGLGAATRHRAMADAELTAAVLGRILDLLEGNGVTTVGELLSAQDEPGGRHRVELRVPRRRLELLPEARGVYWLVDDAGQALFVDRSDNIREQVLSYYVATAHLSARQLEMASATADFDCRQTGSELETQIALAEEVRRRKPIYNRSDRHLPRGNFVKVSMRGPFPRLLVTSRISGDGGLYLGPIRGRAFAEDAAAMLARVYQLRTCAGHLEPNTNVEPCELGPAGHCSSPCNAAVDTAAYRHQVKRLENDLLGDGSGPRRAIAREEDKSSGGAARRDAALLSRLLKLHRRRHWLVNRHNYLAVAPAAAAAVVVVLVLGGYCRRVGTVANLAELQALLGPTDALVPTRRQRVRPYEADVSSVMAHWIRRTSGSDDCVIIDLDPGDLRASLDAATTELLPVLESLG